MTSEVFPSSGASVTEGHGRRPLRKASFFAGRYSVIGLTVLLACLFLFPLFWMLSTSGMTISQSYASPTVWWPLPFRFSNYPNALRFFPFVQDLLNTLHIAVPVTVGTVLSSSFVAYGFACLKWKGRDVVFYIVLATMMIPTWATIVPLYILFDKVGWVNTFKPLWVPAFFGDPFSIFLLRQFFLSIPGELLSAARVDGASEFRIYRSIVLRLSKPALAVVALFAFIYSWTDFFGPLVYLSSPNLNTLQLGLLSFFGHYYISWPGFMAGSILVLLPVIVFFLATQRTFIEGIAMTGLRR